MSARERILMIRLVEKLEKHPVYAKALGVEANRAVKHPNAKSQPKGLTEM